MNVRLSTKLLQIGSYQIEEINGMLVITRRKRFRRHEPITATITTLDLKTEQVKVLSIKLPL